MQARVEITHNLQDSNGIHGNQMKMLPLQVDPVDLQKVKMRLRPKTCASEAPELNLKQQWRTAGSTVRSTRRQTPVTS